MNKKILSSILAGVMTVSTLSIAASADAPDVAKLDESKKSYEVEAGMNAPTITASIPTEIGAFINPYKAIVTDDDYGSSFASGIASPTYYIENGMDDKLAVTVTPSIASSKTVEISEKPLKSNLTEKTVFAYLNTTTLTDGTNALFRNTHYDANDASQAVFKEEGEATANIMIIGDKADTGNTKGYFRIEGECTEKPEDAWADTDTVNLSLVLDLAPSAGEVKDATLTALTVTGAKLVEKFDPAITSYTAKADTTKTALTVGMTAKDAVAFASGTTKGKIYVFYNKTKAAATFTPTNGVVTAASVFPTGVQSYNVGDVIEVVVANDIYTQTYTITIVE